MVISKSYPGAEKRNKPIQYKALAATEVKVSAEGRTISGYAAIWGNIDDARDVLIKGCCSKSISERGPESKTNRKIIFLWMHDTDEPLGRITKLAEDDKGLYFEAVVDAIPEGDRALEQLKSGTLNQFSIGYQYVWQNCEWDGEKDAFIVKEINLFEISVVSFGCNEETGFEGMKSASEVESAMNKLARDTDKFIKNLPYEDGLKIRQLITKHIALHTAMPGKPHEQGEPQETEVKKVDFSQLLLTKKTN